METISQEEILATEDLLREILKRNLSDWQVREKLTETLQDVSAANDRVHRFYKQNFKAFKLQEDTLLIARVLMDLLPQRTPCIRFLMILGSGTNKEFHIAHNDHWDEQVRPIIEAFFHAKFFLEQAISCARRIDEGSFGTTLSSTDWVTLCGLYGL